MKKLILVVTLLALITALCACGDSEDKPEAYSPTDIKVEKADGGNIYSLIYDIDINDDEQWSGYPEHENELQTAINGIKECMQRDDWTDDSVIYGYAKKALLKNTLYSYGYDGTDGNYDSIKFFQLGIYNTTYQLTDELE